MELSDLDTTVDGTSSSFAKVSIEVLLIALYQACYSLRNGSMKYDFSDLSTLLAACL